jgi:glycosyltransferase involved in cell wall biosynthesis
MIKVLHVVNSLGTGGAELMLVRLLEGMDRKRFDNTVVSLLRIDTFAPKLHKLDIRTESLDIRGGTTVISSAPRLIRLIKDVRPDLVQTWMYHSNLLGLLANRRAGNAPLSWSVHSSELDFSTYSFGLKLLFKVGARLASMPNATVFTSYLAQQWHERLGFKPRRWQYVPAGVDTSIFRPDSHSRTSLRNELGLRHDELIVGTVARFHAQKDYPTFLRAFAELCRIVPTAHAVMVGADVTPANRGLVQLAQHLGIGDRVHMLGLRSDIQWIVGGFDLFVLTSAFGESCPTVLIEAMACGVPCVATEVGDSARIIGDTGKIVPVRNSSALAAACVEVLANRGASSSAAARQRIQECYSLETMTKRFADLFEDLAGRRPAEEGRYASMERTELAMEHNPTAQ